MVVIVFIWEFVVGGWLAKWAADAFGKADYERKKRELELQLLEAQLPPKPEKLGWFFGRKKEPKPRTRSEQVKALQTQLAEELKFCQFIVDPVSREAAELSANARFRERLVAVMEGRTP